MTPDTTRKLATIVALDVAGYSARTEADEARTTAEVAALRKVIEAIAAKHGGRVFNTAGDGFMLEFGSSLGAVEAAFELAETCEPKVRVGVHLGDVVVQPNGDLLGHGVNVAARLMAKSEPGGALVSGAVRQSIRGPVAERLHSQGMMQLDKMAETIEAFAVTAAASMTIATQPKSAEPLVAVLPFDNLSSDPEMQFFSDGVSEEIIQRLSRGAKLKVIGRTSSFQFRGDKKADAARALRCTHVLDGSIRRAAGRVRVAAHLVDTSSQTTLWSDRYDHALEDIFAIQDEIAENIAGALNRSFSSTAIAPLDPETYDLYLRGSAPGFSPEQLHKKISLLEEVTKRAPKFADGWAKLAEWRSLWHFHQPYPQRKAIAKLISTEAELALSLDRQNYYAKTSQLLVLPPFGNFLEYTSLADQLRQDTRSLSYSPFYDLSCLALVAVGRVREATTVSERRIERDSLNAAMLHTRGLCLWLGGRFAEARQSFNGVLDQWPDYIYSAFDLIMLAAFAEDWATVDALLAPERLAKFPLGHLTRYATGMAAILRDPSPQSRRRPIEAARRHFAETGHADINSLAFAAQMGFVDDVYEIAAKAKFGPAGDGHDVMGPDAYRTNFLFHAHYPAIRSDPRFVELCARLGLVEYWLSTQHWPDCADEVPYDFKAACEKARSIPKEAFEF